jgi:DNA-binding CsgD family transcriptional regulator
MRIHALIVEQGLRDQQIAEALRYTRSSVRQTVHRILDKRGVQSRLQLVVQHWKAKTNG